MAELYYAREELLLCTCTNCGQRNANRWKALNELAIGRNILDALKQSDARQNEGSSAGGRGGMVDGLCVYLYI